MCNCAPVQGSCVRLGSVEECVFVCVSVCVSEREIECVGVCVRDARSLTA